MSSAHEPDGARAAHFDVRLLGTVRVVTPAGDLVDLGGPKPRMVLVRLALGAGETVSAETLVDVLWGDDPPPTARRSLQAHVAKLRVALGGGNGPLRPNGPGYVLDLRRDEVDVLRIEDRLGTARGVLADDPRHAAELIDRCRGDWTGSPLADLEREATLTADRERLLRLGDELADTELDVQVALGDPGAAVVRLERAVADQPTHEPHWMRLVTAYYAAGRQHDALEAYQRAAGTMRDELGVDPSPQLQRLELQILSQAATSAEPGDLCPYKGLVSYQIADGENFHGRSAVTDELVNLVTNAPFGVVVGPSGVGKSSVIRAGLGHRIVTGRVPELRTLAVMTPGPRPLRSFYEASPAVDLLIVDQFEELFTLTDDESRRAEFLEELLALAESGRTRVLLSVRADFYGHCLSMPALAARLGRHQVNVGAMTTAGLREAILGPAHRAGLEVEPQLLSALVEEVADRPGALPLLSHALGETWRRRSGSTLTLQGYQDAGSIGGAISATAERIYRGLDAHGQDELGRLLRRLVEPGSGTQHTRRAAERAELDSAGFESGLVDRLVDARLLTAGTERVEIAHEALITEWSRLAHWVDDARDDIVAHRRLGRAASAWRESGEDDAELYRGNKLEAARAWEAETGPVLSADEAAFLQASAEQVEAEVTRQRRANRRLRVLTAVSIVGLVVAVLASVLAVGRTRDAERRRDEVEINELARIVAADTTLNQTDRLRVAVALESRTSTLETSSLLFEEVVTAPDITAESDFDIIAVTGQAPTYATGQAIQVADLAARPAVVSALTAELDRSVIGFVPRYVVGRPEGLLAVHPETYEVIDLAANRPIGPAPRFDRPPSVAALSPGGDMLLLGYDADESDPARVEVIASASGSLVTSFDIDGTELDQLEFRDPSRLIIVVDKTALELWDTQPFPVDGLEPTDLPPDRLFRTTVDPGFTSSITTSAFNVWGDAVAIGRRDGSIEIWRETESGWRRLAPPVRHTAAVSWVEFDYDDTLVASSAIDGTVVLSDAGDGSLRAGPLKFGTSGELISFFQIDTGEVITIGSNGHTWRWFPRAGGGLIETIDVVAPRATPRPNGGWFGVRDGAAVEIQENDVTDVGLDQDVLTTVGGRSGDYVVTYADRLEWRRPDGELVLAHPFTGTDIGGLVAVAAGRLAYVDTQARRLFVIGDDGVVLEEIEVSEVRGDIARLDVNDRGRDLIFSTVAGELVWYSLERADAAVVLGRGDGHDGQFVNDDLVVAIGEGGIRLIDLSGSTPLVTELSIGREGRRVALGSLEGLAATTDGSGAVTLWDVVSGQQVGPSFDVLSGQTLHWLAIVSDRLIAGSERQTAAVLVGTQDWLRRACEIAEAADPDGELPADPRFEGFEACT